MHPKGGVYAKAIATRMQHLVDQNGPFCSFSVFAGSRLTFLAKLGILFSQNWNIKALTARYIRHDGQWLKEQNSTAELASPNKNVDAMSF